MKYGLLSDCHGNIQGLVRAWQMLREAGAQKMLCLGDIVGYGAASKACIDFLMENSSRTIAGNHDHALLKKHSTEQYQSYAVHSLELAREQLRAKHLQFLEELPLISTWEEDGFLIQLTHAHPKSYEDWCYYPKDPYYSLLSPDSPLTAVAFYGHTHQPRYMVSSEPEEIVIPKHFKLYSLASLAGKTLVVNVGSCGQPRDGDTRVCSVLFDTEEKHLIFLRGEYSISSAQKDMRDLGLDGFVVERLNYGR